MSDSQQRPWSNSPNAPKIPYDLYFREKAYFSGTFIGAMLYGIVVMLFFKCMTALLNPTHRRGERINWGLVSYTVATFSFVTVLTAANFRLLSICNIDNREFPGVKGVAPPGPYGYQLFISPEALSVIPSVMLTLGNWLADGLLLYRCYTIYSMNLWVIALPCLIFLGSFAMGIVVVYQSTQPTSSVWSALPYFSISLSLHILLTTMIIIRLIMHARNTRTAMGGGICGLYQPIVTMLIESCALYAVSSLLVIGTLGGGSPAVGIFLFILPEMQAIAPLLIIQRVANKSAFTSNTVASGHVISFKARSRGQFTDGSGTLPDTSSVDEYEMSSRKLEVGVDTTIDFHWDKI